MGSKTPDSDGYTHDVPSLQSRSLCRGFTEHEATLEPAPMPQAPLVMKGSGVRVPASALETALRLAQTASGSARGVTACAPQWANRVIPDFLTGR